VSLLDQHERDRTILLDRINALEIEKKELTEMLQACIDAGAAAGTALYTPLMNAEIYLKKLVRT
jgi:hypothetical protein